jgi:hypothetical protein
MQVALEVHLELLIIQSTGCMELAGVVLELWVVTRWQEQPPVHLVIYQRVGTVVWEGVA